MNTIQAVINGTPASPFATLASGQSSGSVLGNDTLNNVPNSVSLTNVDLTVITGATPNATAPAGSGLPFLNVTTGNVDVPANTPSGTYTIAYNICEKGTNPLSSVCDNTTVTINVLNPIIANPNTASIPNGNLGGSVTNITLDDTLNGVPVVIGTLPGQVSLTQVGTLPTGLTLNPINGIVTVAPLTPAGTYTFDYTICENGALPTNCSTTTVTIIVKFDADLEVFNGLTPNGDGLDDVFKILGIEYYPNNSVEIFNRWGVLVYEVQGYNNNDKSFRGESNGRVTIAQDTQLPEGTYFYILKYNKVLNGSGEAKDQAGYLYINR